MTEVLKTARCTRRRVLQAGVATMAARWLAPALTHPFQDTLNSLAKSFGALQDRRTTFVDHHLGAVANELHRAQQLVTFGVYDRQGLDGVEMELRLTLCTGNVGERDPLMGLAVAEHHLNRTPRTGLPPREMAIKLHPTDAKRPRVRAANPLQLVIQIAYAKRPVNHRDATVQLGIDQSVQPGPSG
jgi:hypothetical protein